MVFHINSLKVSSEHPLPTNIDTLPPLFHNQARLTPNTAVLALSFWKGIDYVL